MEAKTTSGAKGGLNTSSRTFYDPWGSAYFIKLNTDYDNVVEYYGNNYVIVIVGSMGPNKKQDAPSGPDDIFNFKRLPVRPSASDLIKTRRSPLPPVLTRSWASDTSPFHI